MASPGGTPLLTPEEIAARAGSDVPQLRLPDGRTLFAERGLRLRRLAAGHAMRDYLMFIAELAQAQHDLLASLGPVALPDAQELRDAALQGLPPLPATLWPRDPAWRDGLRTMLRALGRRTPPGPAAEILARVAAADDAWLEQQADRLLSGVTLELDLAAAPLVGAALQVYWTHLVAQVQQAHEAAVAQRATGRGEAAAGAGGLVPAVPDRDAPFGRIDDAAACPCCGSRPAASVTRLGAQVSGQRYLHCALCAAEWQRPRISCARCGNGKDIYYHALEAQPGHAAPATAAPPGTVQAECCDACGHYLKIMHMEKDPQVDPVADDLASVTLDLLVSESGLQRHGVNLMLLFGDPEPPPDAGVP
jgi:FdhE protein